MEDPGSTSIQLSILPFTVKNLFHSNGSCSPASIPSKRSSKPVKCKPGRPKKAGLAADWMKIWYEAGHFSILIMASL